MQLWRLLLSGLVVVISYGTCAPVTLAQAAEAATIEEVVVTARKRAEPLQNIPVAVSVVTSDWINRSGAVDVRDIAKASPGLFYESFDSVKPNLYLRGIGTRSYDAGAESSVGTFIDGVYIGRFGAQLQDLADVERVEVLKGPQGALFGRNTIAGAINIITRKPSDTFEAGLTGTAGFNEHFDGFDYGVSGYVSGPLSDNASGQISFSRSSIEGTTRLLGRDRLANGGGTDTLRAKLRWMPNARLSIDLTADYFESFDGLLAWRQNDVDGARPVPFLLAPGLDAPIDPDPYVTSISPGQGETARHGSGVTLLAEYEAEGVDITSITSYRKLDYVANSDIDSTTYDAYHNPSDQESSQFSQELRFASQIGSPFTFDGKVDWLFGFYYFTESPLFVTGADFGVDNLLTVLFTGGVPTASSSGQDVETDSYAVFGQLGIQVTERIKLDLGIRYSEDDKSARLFLTGNRFGVTNFDRKVKRTFDSVDPSLSLTYEVSNDVMVYASYAHGFKSGAFQFAATNEVLASQIVEPEEVDAYQAGIKADLLDRKLRANFAAFRYDYKDIQVPRFEVLPGQINPTLTLSNAAESTIQGFEIEGVALLGNSLRLEYGYAYLDAEYDEYIYNATTDFSGNRLPRSPENTLNATFVYETDTSFGSLAARISANYSDDFYFESDNEDIDLGTEEPSKTLVDASVQANFDRYSVKLWAKNLGDKEYRASVLNASGLRLLEVWAPRRSIGVTISAQW